MKTLYLFIGLIVLFFSSCEEVIEIDINDANPEVIIEAIITDLIGPYTVKITKSGDFYEPGIYETISNAIIILSDDDGNSEILEEIEEGIYQTDEIIGLPGKTYKLSIDIEGKNYYASSTMPEKVILEKLTYKYSEISNPHQTTDGYSVSFMINDPANALNYYRLKIYRNGELYTDAQNYIILWDDKLFDGNRATLPIKKGGELFQLNDTLDVELHTLNKESYWYYRTLNNVITKDNPMGSFGKQMMEGSTAPANPETNWTNGALGFFTTSCVSTKRIVIEKEL